MASPNNRHKFTLNLLADPLAGHTLSECKYQPDALARVGIAIARGSLASASIWCRMTLFRNLTLWQKYPRQLSISNTSI